MPDMPGFSLALVSGSGNAAPSTSRSTSPSRCRAPGKPRRTVSPRPQPCPPPAPQVALIKTSRRLGIPKESTARTVGVPQILPNGVTYIHLLFVQHDLIEAEGTWTESFQPVDRALGNMGVEQRAKIEALFPELSNGANRFPAACITLKS